MSVRAELRACLRPALALLALAALLAGAARLAVPVLVPAAVAGETPLALTPADLAARPGWLASALVIDARPASAYSSGHYAGALRLAPAEWEELLPAVIERWEPGRAVLVYCEADGCALSREVAARLRRELADSNIHALDGDWRVLPLPPAP